MFWSGLVGSDKRNIYFSLLGGGKLHFCFFGCVSKSLQSLFITFQIYPLLFFKLFYQKVDYLLVKIITTQMGISGRGFHLKYPFAKFQDGDVKSTSTKIVNCNGVGFFFI